VDGYGARQEAGLPPGSGWPSLFAHVDPTLEDYIEAAALAEGVPIDEYAGALLQVGWDAVFGFRGPIGSPGRPQPYGRPNYGLASSSCVPASHTAVLVHGRNSETADGEEPDVRLVEADDSAVPRHDQLTWTTLGPAPPASGKTRPFSAGAGCRRRHLPAAVLDDATEVRIAC